MRQGLSKAYNRIDIDLLGLALNRINIPDSTADFIIDLFTIVLILSFYS